MKCPNVRHKELGMKLRDSATQCSNFLIKPIVLNAIIPSVVMLKVVTLSVVAPLARPQ